MLIAFLCFVSCLPSYQGISNIPIPRTIFPSEIYHLMFGDLLDMKYLFLPGDDDSRPSDRALDTNMSYAQMLSDEYRIGNIEDIWNSIKKPLKGPQGSDQLQFDQLNMEMFDARRRATFKMDEYYEYDSKDGKFDKHDADLLEQKSKIMQGLHWISWGLLEDHSERNAIEFIKIKQMKTVPTQFLMMSRDMIARSLKQRNKIRQDKRYQLGFLFCRLRRLKTEMLKFIASMEKQLGHTKLDQNKMPITLTSIYLYEAVVRLDVDIRDTIKYINELYEKPEPYDYDYVVPSTK